MAEVDQSFIAEMLREIRSDIAEMKRDLHRLEVRQTVIEGQLGTIIVSMQIMREELDEVRDDVRLIKRRLSLSDAA